MLLNPCTTYLSKSTPAYCLEQPKLLISWQLLTGRYHWRLVVSARGVQTHHAVSHSRLLASILFLGTVPATPSQPTSRRARVERAPGQKVVVFDRVYLPPTRMVGAAISTATHPP